MTTFDEKNGSGNTVALTADETIKDGGTTIANDGTMMKVDPTIYVWKSFINLLRKCHLPP